MSTTKNVTRSIRFGAVIVDHFLFSIVVALFGLPALLFQLSNQSNESLNGISLYVGLIGFALYFCKDCIDGKSPAKLLFHLQIVDNKSGNVSSPAKYVLRNMLNVVWPIEVIVLLISPDRRLGDIIAQTRLVTTENQQSIKSPNIKSLVQTFLVVYLTLAVISTLVNSRTA